MIVRASVLRGAALLAAALVVSAPAEARRGDPAGPATMVEPPKIVEPAKVVEPTGTWTSGTQPERDCGRARRKFWLPQEGWIVRTVVSCR
ncbi:hypothetical protein [Methylobacterium sp. GXS13]|uniref:hypothetical protein n=1 Tax=Methylobacterium sp. GXS13 TaxID=1730094 RepID=UPI001AED102B|nr:hypothetical protein [Methylobacterium sp. GXS13]